VTAKEELARAETKEGVLRAELQAKHTQVIIFPAYNFFKLFLNILRLLRHLDQNSGAKLNWNSNGR